MWQTMSEIPKGKYCLNLNEIRSNIDCEHRRREYCNKYQVNLEGKIFKTKFWRVIKKCSACLKSSENKRVKGGGK